MAVSSRQDLVAGGDLEVVEHRQEDVGGGSGEQRLGEDHHCILRPVHVHLRRDAQQGDGGQEAAQCKCS